MDLLFQRYIRYLAHIINLIVKDILRDVGSGNRTEANEACDSHVVSSYFAAETALGKLRVLAVYIQRSP